MVARHPPYLPDYAVRFPSSRLRRLAAQLLDALLDPLGQLALVLQRAQRVARLLQHEFELRDLLGDVVDDSLLLAQRLEVDPHVVQQVDDGVGLGLHLVDQLAA